MSIEKITARILQEAQAEAEAMKASVEKDSAAVLEAAQAEAAGIKADAAAQAKVDAAVLLERKKSVAELEARKMRLAAKQEMIEKSFAAALEDLKAMPEEKYVSFLLEQLKSFDQGEIVLNAEDKKKIGDKIAAKVAGTGLKISDETADIAGGFFLKNGNVSINGSLEAVLDGMKKQITAQIAQILFS